MIAYLNTSSHGVPVHPAWLEGWEPSRDTMLALCHRDIPLGHMVGVGDPLTFAPPLPNNPWKPLDEGWNAVLLGKTLDPEPLARTQLWFDVAPTVDLHRRQWMAPRILTEDGRRAFRVSYGSNWLPALTPEQERAEEIAHAAREELKAGNNSGLEMPVACQWCAEFLSLVYHLSPGVFSALALVDDVLAVGVLTVATGLNLSIQEPTT